MGLSVIVLAAGQGRRMGTAKPKVLQILAGRPLLHHVLSSVNQLHLHTQILQTIVVCGYKGDDVVEACGAFTVDWVWQTHQLGTGDAVKCALPKLTNSGQALILSGDVPFIQEETLLSFIKNTPPHSLGILTAKVADPSGLGRIVRDDKNKIIKIIEEKDANETELDIKEINAGIYLIPTHLLEKYLPTLCAKNAQQEYYLTDLIKKIVKDGGEIKGEQVCDASEIHGINNQAELAKAEKVFRQKKTQQLLAVGVKIYDPHRVDVRGEVQFGKDVMLDINVILEGKVILGDDVVIGPNVYIKDSTIGAETKIYANSVIESSFIGPNCKIGPFARVRPGTKLHKKAKVGNFVEIKNTEIGCGSKVNHLSYLGDTVVGENVNIGAGTITCNYDGVNKYQTIIEDNAFIGSNSELIAPVVVGKEATVAAGTTLMRDAPAGKLSLTKKSLVSVAWQRPVKLNKSTEKN